MREKIFCQNHFGKTGDDDSETIESDIRADCPKAEYFIIPVMRQR